MKEYIRRLDITVDDVFPVQKVQTASNHLHQIKSCVSTHSRVDPLFQITILKKFHGYVVPLANNTNVIDSNNVTVI